MTIPEYIYAAIDNHIRVWSTIPSFAPLAEVLKMDRQILSENLVSFLDRDEPDAIRLFIFDFAAERAAGRINSDHFTLFRDAETVQVILEDSFGFIEKAEQDEIEIPYQNEALKIMVRCLFSRAKQADETDVLSFLQMFSGEKTKIPSDLDRIMRMRSLLWFIYLAIEIIKTEVIACRKGLEYFRKKFQNLLDRAIDGTIINEESRLPGFEEGKWERTLFGWLQGEDRREFTEKLKRQFNMENRVEHVNRRLLAEHRRCVFEQVLIFFC